MNDLNIINRLNAEAFADSIHRYRAAGKHVLAQYEGLHLVSIETFSTTKPDVTLGDYINRKII